MAAMDSVKAKFDEYEYLLKLMTAKIEELAAENERLRAAAGAHGVLKLIYSDNDQPTGHRIKAAGLALQHETPKLMPERQALELKAIEPKQTLGQLCEVRMARADRMEALSLEERERLIRGCGNGNGSDDSDDGNGQDDQ
jgi:hypothetical protein